MEILKQRAGIDMLHVPYKGGAPAMVDLVSKAGSPEPPLVGVAREVKDPHQTSGMDVPPGGFEPTVFLMADAVACAKTGQTTPEGYYNLERMLRRHHHRVLPLVAGQGHQFAVITSHGHLELPDRGEHAAAGREPLRAG